MPFDTHSSDKTLRIQDIIKSITHSILTQLNKSLEDETNGRDSKDEIHREGFISENQRNFDVENAISPQSFTEPEHQTRIHVDELSEQRRALRIANRGISFKEIQLEVLKGLCGQTERELLELEEEKKRRVAAADDLIAKRDNGSLPNLPAEIISRIFFFVNLHNHISRGLSRISLVGALLEDPQICDEWKRIIARDVPFLLSDRTYLTPTLTSTSMTFKLGARYTFHPFLPCPQFDPTTYAYPVSDPPLEVLRHAMHVAVVFYASPKLQYPFKKTDFDLPCTQLFVHPSGGEPVTVTREILEMLGNSLLNLRVLDVNLPTFIPYSSDAVSYMKPDEEWSPFADSESTQSEPDFTQSMIHTARIPLSFLPSMLPAFSNLRYFGLTVPASPVTYNHLLSSLRTLPQKMEELVLENADSRWEEEELAKTLQNEPVELPNLKELKLRKFSQQVNYALMRQLLCPSLLSFSVLFDNYYHNQLDGRATEPNEIEGLDETEENLPRRIGVSYPTLKTLDISTSRQPNSKLFEQLATAGSPDCIIPFPNLEELIARVDRPSDIFPIEKFVRTRLLDKNATRLRRVVLLSSTVAPPNRDRDLSGPHASNEAQSMKEWIDLALKERLRSLALMVPEVVLDAWSNHSNYVS